MWRSRLRAAFLSNRDEVNAGFEPSITLKTGYDIYRLLGAVFYIKRKSKSIIFMIRINRIDFEK